MALCIGVLCCCIKPSFGDGSQFQISTNTVPPPNQSEEQLQTIVRTFKKLPFDEIEKYEIDLSDEKVEVGTLRAANLLKAWKTRQEELKEAMKSIMKPAEMMANITQQLKIHGKLLFPSDDTAVHEETNSKDTVLQLLIDLESLLADIDNARDFHTIEAWPTLLGFLDKSFPLPVRTKAVWAVGTAMKNSYDYQLWILEKTESLIVKEEPKTGMEMLLEMFEESSMMSNMQQLQQEKGEKEERIEFQKRVLYALSSALRGNLDIQETILNRHSTSFYSSLEKFLSFPSAVNTTDISVMRKVYSLISDLFEERQYIRYELPLLSSESKDETSEAATEVKINEDGSSVIDLKGGNDNSSSTTSAGGVNSELLVENQKKKQQQIADYLSNLRLLTDYFFQLPSLKGNQMIDDGDDDWSVSLFYHLQHYYSQLKHIHQKYIKLGEREKEKEKEKDEKGYDFESIEERNDWINLLFYSSPISF
jgi:hypothetical protein